MTQLEPSTRAPVDELAAQKVLETAKACGCDTRVGAVAFGLCGSRLTLHLERLQAAAAVWRYGLSRRELAKACAKFACSRDVGDSSGEVCLTPDDVVELREMTMPKLRPLAGHFVVEALSKQIIANLSSKLPPWGHPVASDHQWVKTVLPVLSAMYDINELENGSSHLWHIAFGALPTWQTLRCAAEITADDVSCGCGVQALEVDLSWKNNFNVARPPYVLRP